MVFAKCFQTLENKVPGKCHGCEPLAVWEAWPLEGIAMWGGQAEAGLGQQVTEGAGLP